MSASLAEAVQSFASDLAVALDGGLVSVILYGDALLPEAPRDPVSLLVILRDLDLPSLERVGGVLQRWRRRQDFDPVLFTPQELAESLDVFPVELSRARAAYLVVHGQDVLADLQVDPEHLRLQLEEDLRTKRLWLRQRVVMLGSRDTEAARESFRTLPALLRAMLRWRGQPAAGTVDAVLDEAARTFALDADLLATLRSRQRLTTSDLERYLALLDALIALVQGG